MLPIEVATLLGGMSWRCDIGDGPSATCPPHGLASADPGSNEMVEVRAFSINLLHNQVGIQESQCSGQCFKPESIELSFLINSSYKLLLTTSFFTTLLNLEQFVTFQYLIDQHLI